MSDPAKSACDVESERAQALIKTISMTCVELYPANLADPEVQIALAALSQNVMFQRIATYARRADLMIALSQVESQIARAW